MKQLSLPLPFFSIYTLTDPSNMLYPLLLSCPSGRCFLSRCIQVAISPYRQLARKSGDDIEVSSINLYILYILFLSVIVWFRYHRNLRHAACPAVPIASGWSTPSNWPNCWATMMTEPVRLFYQRSPIRILKCFSIWSCAT